MIVNEVPHLLKNNKKIMKRLFLMCLVASVILLSSCKEEVPSFPQQLRYYNPYKTGDTVSYTTAQNDTIHFVVDNVYATPAHKHSRQCKCGNITEYHYSFLSDTLTVECYMSVDEKTVRIYVTVESPDGDSNIYGTEYSCGNPYLEDVTNNGDNIVLTSDDGSTIQLIKEVGINNFHFNGKEWKIIIR